MKGILKHINNNKLVKVASLNSVSVFLKIISGFLTSKFVAIYIGVEGLALLGNLRDFVNATRSFSILGMYSGVIKYVAEFKKNNSELSKLLSTSFYLGLLATSLICLVSYFFSDEISESLFNDSIQYSYVIKFFALLLPLYGLNQFCYAIINGFSKFKLLIYLSIFGQILGAVITLFLIWRDQIEGALLAIVATESLLVVITLIGIRNKFSLAPLLKRSSFDFRFVKRLGSYSIMALFSAILLPLVAFSIRVYITDELGLQSAGLWEAMNRISKYYLMFVSTLLGMYILPKLSQTHTIRGFREEVFNFYKNIIPLFALGLILIYVLRNVIITCLFTSEFYAVEELFLWQLLGDFVKVLAIVITYQFLAKKMFWHYIIVEGISVILLYVFSVVFIDIFGVKGANIAHFATFIVHYGIVMLIFKKELFGRLPQNEI